MEIWFEVCSELFNGIEYIDEELVDERTLANDFCMTDEERETYFSSLQLQLYFFQAANYIDFEDMDSPLKKLFVQVGQPTIINDRFGSMQKMKLNMNNFKGQDSYFYEL